MIATLAVCVTLLLLWWRAEPMLRELVKIHGLRWQRVPDPESIEIPKDLLGHAASYIEEWAQADVIRTYREDYLKLGSWDLVRMKHGQATKD